MAHKELKYDSAARQALEAGVDAVANAVKVTLGPRGRYVVLDKKFGAPTITNDGVTIAREIEVEDDVTAARAERHLDRVGDRVDALLERLARLRVVLELLVSHLLSFLLGSKSVGQTTFARTSDSRSTSRSSPSTLISVPPYLL